MTLDVGSKPTCDKHVGLLPGAGAQELHGIGVVHLAQHLQLRAEVPQGNGAGDFEDLGRHQGAMPHGLVHDAKFALACRQREASIIWSLCKPGHCRLQVRGNLAGRMQKRASLCGCAAGKLDKPAP